MSSNEKILTYKLFTNANQDEIRSLILLYSDSVWKAMPKVQVHSKREFQDMMLDECPIWANVMVLYENDEPISICVMTDPIPHMYMKGKGIMCLHVFTLKEGALAKLYRMICEILIGQVDWIGRFKSDKSSANLVLTFKYLKR